MGVVELELEDVVEDADVVVEYGELGVHPGTGDSPYAPWATQLLCG